MAWTDEAFADLREDLGRGGITEVKLWSNRPPVKLDLSGMEALILLGKVHAGLMTTAVEVANMIVSDRPDAQDDEDEDEDAAERPVPESEPAETPPAAVVPQTPVDPWEAERTIARWHDELCNAIFVEPAWCPLAELPPDSRPVGRLCLLDLTKDQRRYIVDLAFKGVKALDSFRTESSSPNGALHGDGLRDDASGPTPESESPAAPEVVAESSDLDAGEAGGVATGPGHPASARPRGRIPAGAAT